MLRRTWNPNVQWDPKVEEYLSVALGNDRLNKISQALVTPPLKTCLRVNRLQTTPEQVIRQLPDQLSPIEKEIMERNGQKPYIHPKLPFAVIVPGTGPHAIDYSACEGREVIVGRKAGESMIRGSHGYAPGILAVTAGIEEGDTVAVSVGIEVAASNQFGVTRGTIIPRNLSLDDERFPNRANLFIGTARAEVSRSGMDPSKTGLVLTMKQRVFESFALGGLLTGDVMLQNVPSFTAAVVLNPTQGSRVIDMCASPGGKTTAMAEIMQNKGEIIALDRSHTKAIQITNLAKELGITIVKAYKQDATKAVVTREEREKRAGDIKNRNQENWVGNDKIKQRMERKAAKRIRCGQEPVELSKANVTDGFDPESFDYVLLDAPCTALGLRPRLVVTVKLEELEATAHYQRNLIDAAVRLLKPGGFMVYSTCTINPGENEANVRYILDKYGSFMRLVDQTPKIGGPGLTSSLPHGKYMQLLTEEEAQMVQRFDPSDKDTDTNGFFIAKFQKVSSSEQG